MGVQERTRKILDLMRQEPNRRIQPQEDDLEGDFDYWFDHGAVLIQTGSVRYYFQDGTTAMRSVLRPGENYISIRFADGSNEIIPEAEW